MNKTELAPSTTSIEGDDVTSNGISNGEKESYEDSLKLFISRIPVSFDEEILKRELLTEFGDGSVKLIALVKKQKIWNNDESSNIEKGCNEISDKEEHRGFAFVTMNSVQIRDEAIKKGSFRCKESANSKKKFTLYIRPVVRDHDIICNPADGPNSCFLWTKFRCPYGSNCKFEHVGEGGCQEQTQSGEGNDKKKKQKCFQWKTKGKCKMGDECPFRHDFEPKKRKICEGNETMPENSRKDCINWKTKGKCRKGPKCPYRHSESVLESFLSRKDNRICLNKEDRSKASQPLSVRVFGLNYETTEDDVRKYFEFCGKIREITFPKFEDSGRSKGYCGIMFTSPKSTIKACELDGQELQGRWLSIQPGKMFLRQWEERESERFTEMPSNEDTTSSSFHRKVKKRKRHGFKD